MPACDVVAVAWEHPRNKQSVYQIVTGDHLDDMAQEFNAMLDRQGGNLRLRDPGDMGITDRYRMLSFLCSHAQWDQDHGLAESWLENDPAETQQALARLHGLTE